MSNIKVRDRNFLRCRCHHICTCYLVRRWCFINFRVSRTYIYLNLLSCSLTNLDLMSIAHIIHDILCELITSSTNTFICNNTTKRDNSDFCRTTTYINNHMTFWGKHIYTYSDSCCHRLVNHIHVSTAGMFARVSHGTDFNLSAT